MATDEHPPLPSYGSLVQTPSGTLPTPQLSKRIVLNVGGVRHEVIWKTLDRLPHSRLGKLRYCTTHEALMELCDDYNFAEMEFFFNRQSRVTSPDIDSDEFNGHQQVDAIYPCFTIFLTVTASNSEELPPSQHQMAMPSADPSTDEHPPLPSNGSMPEAPSGPLPTPQLSKRIVLNVGGVRHEVIWKTLDRLPHTRLGKLRYCTTHEALMELCDDYNFKEMEFFFNRQSRSFSSILNFYQTGQLHLTEDVCVLSIKEDLEYWNIDEQYLESCCQQRYHQRKDVVLAEVGNVANVAESAIEDFGTGRYAKWRQKLWGLYETPQTSFAGVLFAYVTILFVVGSPVSLMVRTLPQYRIYTNGSEGNGSIIDIKDSQINDVWLIMDVVFITWFTLEFVLRLWASPSRLDFIKDAFNIIDIEANVFYYISLMLYLLNPRKNIADSAMVLPIFRIVRVFKLARHSPGLKSLGRAIGRSFNELMLLVMSLAIGVIVFSTLIYFAEIDEHNNDYFSIPYVFWWVVVTMTTVGAGDRRPLTVWGKVVGAACCICGVLFIVLPIPILVNNFMVCYGDQINRDNALKRREAVDLAKGSGDIVSLSAVNGLDVNCNGTGGVGGGKDPVEVQIQSSPLLQKTGRNEKEDQPRLQSIGAVSSI